MNEIESFAEKCYIKRNYTRNYFKIGIVFSLFVVGVAGFVVASTLGVIHYKNMHGQGGLDTPGLPKAAVNIVGTDEEEIFVNREKDQSNDQLYYFSYCIKKGDQIGRIAQDYNVTQDTLISVNNIKSTRLIQPGEYIKIPSMEGILYTVKEDGETPESIAKGYEVDAQKCAMVNNKNIAYSLKQGDQIFVPDAMMDSVTKQEINGDLFSKPLKGWYYISSEFGYRKNPFDSSKRTYHGGLDMASPSGTSIYAALSGTVTTSSYNSSYGNYVIIKHNGGYKTLYAHMQKSLVKAGDQIVTGQKIGLVGSTGLSTGPHLHFAVYKNGNGINPRSMLDLR